MREVADIFKVPLGLVHHTVSLYRKCTSRVTDPYAQPRCGRRILTLVDEDYIWALFPWTRGRLFTGQNIREVGY